MLKRYIGDKAFYRRMLTIAIPIIISVMKRIRKAEKEYLEAQK